MDRIYTDLEKKMLKMRYKNILTIKAIIVELKKKLDNSDMINSKILNTIDLDMLNIEELRKRYSILAARLQVSLAKNDELTDMLEGAQEKIIQARLIIILIF